MVEGIESAAEAHLHSRRLVLGAASGSQQGSFNEQRMQFCVTHETEFRIIECSMCRSSGVLVGLGQVDSSVCVDCMKKPNSNRKSKVKMEEAWQKVKPRNDKFPKRTEEGHENEELPILTAAEKALIAMVHPAVTITKNSFQQRKFRQDRISLLQSTDKTWATVLPRENLHSRFMVVERRCGVKGRKYIVGNAESVAVVSVRAPSGVRQEEEVWRVGVECRGSGSTTERG